MFVKNIPGNPDSNPPLLEKKVTPLKDQILGLIKKFFEPKAVDLPRRRKTEKKELIESDSLLDKPTDKVGLSQEHLPALLGQMYGDRLIGGSDLEKLPSHVGAQTMRELLSQVKGVPEKLLSVLKQLQTTAEQLSALPKKIQEALEAKNGELNQLNTELSALKQQESTAYFELERAKSAIDQHKRYEESHRQHVNNPYYDWRGYEQEQKVKLEKLKQILQEKYDSYGQIQQKVAALEQKRDLLNNRQVEAEVIQGYAKEVMQSVAQLKNGETFILEGGRTGKSGIEHPVLFEFIKTAAGTYELFVYLTGKESSQYRSVLYTDRKTLIRPIVHYKDIPAAALFFNDKKQGIQPDFFQALIETRVLQQKNFSAEYVAIRLVGHLQKYRVVEPVNTTSGFLSGAQSDSDAWRCVKALIFRHLGEPLYKKTIAEIKCRTLVAAYQLSRNELADDTVRAGQLRTVMRAGARGLLKATLVLKKKGLIDEGTLRTYRATAHDLLKRIKQAELDVTHKRKAASYTFETTSLIAQELKKQRQEALTAAADLVAKATNVEPPAEIIPILMERLPKPKKLKDTLTAFLVRYTQAALYKAQVAEIAHLVAQIPLPGVDGKSPYWTQVPREDRKSILTSLDQILRIFDKATRVSSNNTSPSEANTVYALYALIHSLAVQLDLEKHPNSKNPASLSYYPIYFPGMCADEDPYLMFTAPEDFARRESIVNYFRGTYLNNPNVGYKWGFGGYFGWELTLNKEGSVPYPLFDFAAQQMIRDGVPPQGLWMWLKNLADNHEKLGMQNSLPRAQIERLLRELTSPKNFFEEAGLNYIPSLAHAAFVAHQFSSHPELRADTDGVFKIEINSKKEHSEITYSSGKTALKNQNPSSLSMHPTLGEGYRNTLTKHKWNKRIKGEDSSFEEGEVLKEQGVSNAAIFLRYACEPSLFPAKLISYYQSRLDLLESSDEQTLFEISFFRSVAINLERQYSSYDKEGELLKFHGLWSPYLRSALLPMQSELQQQAFREKCSTFIQEGINRYLTRQPNQRPQVNPLLFFFRLNIRLSRFLGGESLVDTQSLIEHLLTRSDLTAEERSALSLHLMTTYGAKKEELTPSEIEKFFAAWIFYKNTPLASQWHNPLLEKEAEKALYGMSGLLTNCPPDFLHSLLKITLKDLDVGLLPPECLVSSPKPHLVRVEIGEKAFWEMNILTGQLYNESGVLQRVAAPTWVKEPLFTHFFGKRGLSYLQVGTTIYFTDPQLGPYRVVGKEFSKGLQKNVDGVWHQYISPTHLKESGIPSSLLADHSHWYPIGPQKEPYLLICNHKTQQPFAKVNHAGEIVTANGILHALAPSEVLTKFDKAPYCVVETTQKGGTTLSLTRYASLGRQPLKFEIVDNKAVYLPNKNYVLADKQPGGVVGGIRQYLVLTHKEGEKQKVLIPLRPLARYQRLTSKHALDVVDKFKEWEAANEFYTTQKEVHTYLEYDLVDDELIPLTQEGTLYLAFLLYSQREYAQAIEWIRKISYRAPLSPNSVWILENIIQLSQQKIDPSPESAAVALHAWVLGTRARQKSAVEGGSFKFAAEAKSAQATYLRYLHLLPQELLLKPEESGLIKKSRDELNLKHHPEIHKYVASPFSKWYSVNEPTLPYPGAGFSDRSGYYGDCNALNNQSRVLNWTDFLPYPQERQAPPSNYRQPFLLTEQSGNHQFLCGYFPEAYGIAREGSEGERSQLAFRLQVIGELSDNAAPSTAWSFLQYALISSKSSTSPLPHYRDITARWGFAEKIMRDLHWNGKHRGERDGSGETHSTFGGEIPEPPLAAPILPPKAVEPVATPLTLNIPDMESVDQGTLPHLFKTHFTENPKKTQTETNHSFTFDPAWVLSEEEKAFDTALDTVCTEFDKDYKKGKQKNNKQKSYSLVDCAGLKKALAERQTTVKGELAQLESAILELANQKASDDIEYRLKCEAKICPDLTLKHLAALFLKGDAKEFAKANPFLHNPALIQSFAQAFGIEPNPDCIIQQLYNWIGLYMTLSVNMQRFKRAEKICTKILKTPDSKPLKKDALIQGLAEELKPLTKPIYLAHEHPAFLVFEYLSQIAIRKAQAKLLKKLLLTKEGSNAYINRVIQLIMGGGKTTILAVILLKLAARPGRLSLFVTPTSQYASVSHNLRKALRDYFGQDMEEIDVKRDQLNLKMCQEIEDRLTRTIQRGDFLLIKAETLQCLELEFLDLLYKASQASSISNDMLAQINSLRRILLIFREQGDALIDEVDLVLNVLQEMNFPLGDEVHLAPERIDLIFKMFSLFSRSTVPISASETVDLKEKIGLLKNQQTFLSATDLNGCVAQAVAWNFARDVDALQLKGRSDFHPSFYRYISGKINMLCQQMLDQPDHPQYPEWEKELTPDDRKDFEFLHHLKKLAASPGKNEEAAHQIALVKHMFQDVLPITFDKIGRRHYGRGGNRAGSIRPYLQVDAPSDNLFGYHWEAVAYHFQTALQTEMTPEHLKEVAHLYREQAEKYAEKESIRVDQTAEAKDFKKLTDISLFEIDLPGNVEKALNHLKNHIHSLLKLEAETAAESVTYHPLRLTSTGIALVKMLATIRAMSGTPHNAPCYDESLAENFEPALGTEGKIADTVLNRAAAPEGSHTHLVKERAIEKILEEVLGKHPSIERVKAWLDSGALFKNYTNLEVAKALKQYLKMPIFFFMRNPNTGEKTPDTLALLPLESDTPVIVGGTRPEDIEKTGLDEEGYFVYYDERHTTGTDIPLPPDAIGMMTLDETMMRRSFFQTILRFREYFSHQDVEFVIPEHIVKAFIPVEDKNKHVKLILGAILSSMKNQAIKLSEHFYRSCKQKIDNVFRQELLGPTLLKQELTHASIKEKFTPFIPVTVANQADRPYHQFGALKYPIESMESLTSYKERKLQTFKMGKPKDTLLQKITADIDLILEKARKSPLRPKTILESGTNDLGSEVDILTELAAQVQAQAQQQIDQELLKELQNYHNVRSEALRREDNWDGETFSRLCEQLSAGEKTFTLPDKIKEEMKKAGDFELFTLPSLFDKKWYTYPRDFTDVFDERLLVTKTWALNHQNILPVFHPIQRPAEHLVLIKTATGYRGLLLAQKEARQFKVFLHNQYHSNPQLKNVWLVHRDGTLFEDNPHNPLPTHQQIAEILLQCNIFDGQIDNLDKNPQLTTAWLHGKGVAERKLDFLRLKVAQNTLQKNLFFKSDLFKQGVAHERKLVSRLEAENIRTMGIEKIQEEKDKDVINNFTPAQLNLLLPSQVELVLPHRIPDLRDETLVQALSQHNAPHLTPEQMPLIGKHQVPWFQESVKKTQKIPMTLADQMTEAQFKNLSPSQIRAIGTRPLIERLEPSQCAHIGGEQVKKALITDKEIPHLRSRDAIEALSLDQLPLVERSLREAHLCQKQVLALTPEHHATLFSELTPLQKRWREPPPEVPKPPAPAKKEIVPPPAPSKPPAPTKKEVIPPPAVPTPQPPKPPAPAKKEVIPPPAPPIPLPQPSRAIEETPSVQPAPAPAEPPTEELPEENPTPSIDDAIRSSEPEETPPKIAVITPAHKKASRCWEVTKVVLLILATLVAIGCIVVGSFAIMGTHASFAPRFMVVIAHGLASPITGYAMTSFGGVLLLSLIGFAIYQCKKTK